MKTAKMILAISIMLIVSASSIAQPTRQERKELTSLDREIKKLDFQINRLELKIYSAGYSPVDYLGEIKTLKTRVDSLAKFKPKNVVEMAQRDAQIAKLDSMIQYDYQQLAKMPDVRNLIQDLNWKWNRIEKLVKDRDRIYDRVYISNQIPREMGDKTVHRRLNSNIVRRQEMVIGKIENSVNGTSVSVASISSQPGMITNDGYKVIFHNVYCSNVVFKIEPVDGGDRTAYCLKSGQKEIHYLLPGRYLIHYLSDGVELCSPQILNIDGQVRTYEGESCYNFAYMPSSVRH